jgi:acyl carrier protein
MGDDSIEAGEERGWAGSMIEFFVRILHDHAILIAITPMSNPQTPLEREVAELIVSSLHLESRRAEEIDPQAPLFGGELGLDSIDALEIALAVSKRYGFQLRSDHPDNQRIFSCLRELAAHIAQNRVH